MLGISTPRSECTAQKRHTPDLKTYQIVRIFSLDRQSTPKGGEGQTQTRIHVRSAGIDADTSSPTGGFPTFSFTLLHSVDNCLHTYHSFSINALNSMRLHVEGWSS